MKLFCILCLSLISIFSNANVTSSTVYFVHIDSATDAELANKNLPKVKQAVEQAMAETKVDIKTKQGKFMLSAEAVAKIRDSGFKAETVLWNSFLL